MLDQTGYGDLKSVVAQALRTGAAAELAQEPLTPPPRKRKAAIGGGRFLISKKEISELRSKERLYTDYDPRQAWNAHIENLLAKCEWGETNRTMVRLLIEGLRRMGFTGIQATANAQPAEEPVATRATMAPQHSAAAKGHDSSMTIGVDPTRAAPKPVPTAATALLKGAGRRGTAG